MDGGAKGGVIQGGMRVISTRPDIVQEAEVDGFEAGFMT